MTFLNRSISPEQIYPSVKGERLGWWSVVVPETTTNLVLNPSFEMGTTGWAGVNGGEALARSAAHQTRGAYSLILTPTAGTLDGAYYAITLTANTPYTLSLDLWGVPQVPYAVEVYDVVAGVNLVETDLYGANHWVTIQMSFRTTANTSYRIRARKNASALTLPFYVDGVQLEQKGYATTYCDGDQEDCGWLASPHASISMRSAYTSSGGRVVNLQDFQFTLTGIIGAGLSTFAQVAIPTALLGGALFQRSIPQSRDFALVGRFECTSLIELHRCQQGLLNAVKPSQQTVRLLYNPTQGDQVLGQPIEIDAVYTGGLEGNLQTGLYETAAIGFRVYLPRVIGRSETDSGAALSLSQSVTNANYILERDSNGNWGALGTGANNTVLAVVYGPDSGLYAGGLFTGMSGVANTSRIARWNGTAWSALGTGAADGSVQALAIGPDGSLYAAGSFTGMGGVANTSRIAKWNGSAWSALGTGANSGIVNALAVGPDGSLYAAGTFTLMGGVANTVRIAKWNGSAWSALVSGLDDEVSALAVGPDGTLYAGGYFLHAGATAIDRIARWSGASWAGLASSGANAAVLALAVRPDGTLYAGGSFTTIGGITARVAQWNGSTWAGLGTGVNALVQSLFVDTQGRVWVGGLFTTAGGLALADRQAIWNGSVWLYPDVNMPGTATVYGFAVSARKVAIGFNTSGSTTAAGITSIVNAGTVDVYPMVRIAGPGTLVELINFTTGDALYFNIALTAGETVIMSLGPNPTLLQKGSPGRPYYASEDAFKPHTWTGSAFVSSFRGDVRPNILPGSNPARWHLTPGANSISLFMTNTTAASESTIMWRAPYDSLYGAVLAP